MKLQFSQTWARKKYEKPLREAINFVKGSRGCSDLVVKAFFYVNKGGYRGNYRNTEIHGSYDTEKLNPNIKSVITLKFSERTFYDPSMLTPQEIEQAQLKPATWGRMYHTRSLESMMEDFISLFAHEFKHYLDMRNLHDKSHFHHWEVRAEKFSKQQLEKWKAKIPFD